MRNETAVSKWGHSLAVRIPRSLAQEARLSEGDCVAMQVDGQGRIVLRSARKKYEFRSGLADHDEESSSGNGLGAPQGKESW